MKLNKKQRAWVKEKLRRREEYRRWGRHLPGRRLRCLRVPPHVRGNLAPRADRRNLARADHGLHAWKLAKVHFEDQIGILVPYVPAGGYVEVEGIR